MFSTLSWVMGGSDAGEAEDGAADEPASQALHLDDVVKVLSSIQTANVGDTNLTLMRGDVGTVREMDAVKGWAKINFPSRLKAPNSNYWVRPGDFGAVEILPPSDVAKAPMAAPLASPATSTNGSLSSKAPVSATLTVSASGSYLSRSPPPASPASPTLSPLTASRSPMGLPSPPAAASRASGVQASPPSSSRSLLSSVATRPAAGTAGRTLPATSPSLSALKPISLLETAAARPQAFPSPLLGARSAAVSSSSPVQRQSSVPDSARSLRAIGEASPLDAEESHGSHEVKDSQWKLFRGQLAAMARELQAVQQRVAEGKIEVRFSEFEHRLDRLEDGRQGLEEPLRRLEQELPTLRRGLDAEKEARRQQEDAAGAKADSLVAAAHDSVRLAAQDLRSSLESAWRRDLASLQDRTTATLQDLQEVFSRDAQQLDVDLRAELKTFRCNLNEMQLRVENEKGEAQSVAQQVAAEQRDSVQRSQQLLLEQRAALEQYVESQLVKLQDLIMESMTKRLRSALPASSGNAQEAKLFRHVVPRLTAPPSDGHGSITSRSDYTR